LKISYSTVSILEVWKLGICSLLLQALLDK